MSVQNGMDPERVRQHREEDQKRQAATRMATQQAGRQQSWLDELQSEEFIDAMFGSPGLNRGDGPNFENNFIEERFAAEFSKHRGLGYITRDDWFRMRQMNEAKAILAKQEYVQPNGPGSLCRPDIREAWTGQDGDRPILTDDLSREITETFEEKSLLESLSIDKSGFRGLMETTAVTKTEGGAANQGGSGGLLSKFTFGLLGG